jgi:PSP.
LNYNVDPHLFNTQIIHEDSPNKDHDFPSPEKKIKLDTNSVVTKKKEDSARSSLQNKDVSKDIVKAVNNQKPDTEILFKKTPENPFLNPTKANLVSSFVVPTSQTHIESPKQSTLEEKNLDPYETPKFANEMPLSSSSVILELAPKLRENMQKNQQKSTKNLLSEKLSKNKPWPDFPSSFRPLPGPDFELESFKPGAVSEELASALGMTSNKDPPPYLAKLIKAGLPSYCN